MKQTIEEKYNDTVIYLQNREKEVFITITLQKLKRSIINRILQLSKYDKSPLQEQAINLLKEFQNKKLPFRHSKFDDQIDFIRYNIEWKKSLIRKSTPTKFDFESSTISLVDVEMHKEVLQNHINFIQKVKNICTELDFKEDIIDIIDKRIPILKEHITEWDNIKTYDTYSSDTDLQLIERTQQIYKVNKYFEKLIDTAFNYGIFNHPRPKTFMSLMGILTQVDEDIEFNDMFSIYCQDTSIDNNTKVITNIIQSMVIIEKHARQGGSKDQLARAMYNLYNTHLFEEWQISNIISKYISDEANFNVKKLASYELFKNPPEWLKKLIGSDKQIMNSEIRLKEESDIKKKIMLEKQKIKKQFLKLNYGKRHDMNDEFQNQLFEKAFNGYIDGNYTRLEKDINLQELDKLLNMVKLF